MSESVLSTYRYDKGDYEMYAKRVGNGEVELVVGFYMESQEIRLPPIVVAELAEFLKRS